MFVLKKQILLLLGCSLLLNACGSEDSGDSKESNIVITPQTFIDQPFPTTDSSITPATLLSMSSGSSGLAEEPAISPTLGQTPTTPSNSSHRKIEDPDKFLTFVVNGKTDIKGVTEENELIANTYYNTLDPAGRKDTLKKWYIENCFVDAPSGYFDPPDCDNDNDIGNHALAVYLNNVDLNFGRRMTLRSNSNYVLGSASNPLKNTVASCVDNYEDLHDAIDNTHLLATVCMEYAPPHTDASGKKFTKFYAFDSEGNRINRIDLDGRGEKILPDVCLTCHGGNPGEIDDQTGEFIYSNNGDTQSGFIPWDLNNFLFATANPRYSRAAQEDQFRLLNQAALQTYRAFDNEPDDTSSEEGAEAVRELIRGWYSVSDDDIPMGSVFEELSDFIPEGWNDEDNHKRLYLDVVAPSCRACHVQRGLTSPNNLDFSTYNKFLSYKGSIETQVFEHGTMPLARRTFELFWDNLSSGNQAETLFDELALSRKTNGDITTPGRKPVAKFDAPKEITKEKIRGNCCSIKLNAHKSLFASKYKWQIIEQPSGATAEIVAEARKTPITQSPARDSTTNDNTPTFTWTEVPGTIRYAVVAKDRHGNYLINNSTGSNIPCPGGICSYTRTSAVLPDGNYTWHVRVINPDNSNGPQSKTVGFIVKEDDSTPITQSPFESTTINNSTPAFTWTEVAGTIRYAVVVKDSNNNELINNSTESNISCPESICSYIRPGVALPDGYYTWHVRVINPDNSNGPQSSTTSFIVDTTNSTTPSTNRPDVSLSVLTITNIGAFIALGDYKVQLTVENDKGVTDKIAHTITVTQTQPPPTPTPTSKTSFKKVFDGAITGGNRTCASSSCHTTNHPTFPMDSKDEDKTRDKWKKQLNGCRSNSTSTLIKYINGTDGHTDYKTAYKKEFGIIEKWIKDGCIS